MPHLTMQYVGLVTGIPYPDTFVSVFDKEQGRVIETGVTDASGKVSFEVPSNWLTVTAENPRFAWIWVKESTDVLITEDTLIVRRVPHVGAFPVSVLLIGLPILGILRPWK